MNYVTIANPFVLSQTKQLFTYIPATPHPWGGFFIYNPPLLPLLSERTEWLPVSTKSPALIEAAPGRKKQIPCSIKGVSKTPFYFFITLLSNSSNIFFDGS